MANNNVTSGDTTPVQYCWVL